MKVIILGSGNAATILGKKIKKAGHTILQVYSPTAAHGKLLGDALGCEYTDQLSKINKNADIYIVALKDSVLMTLFHSFYLDNKLVVHTSGAVAKNVLERISTQYGVLYPLQSLRKEMDEKVEIPFLIDGNTDAVIKQIEDFGSTITSTTKTATDDERLKLHVAAVVVNNFVNHLFVLANDFCDEEYVDFNLLKPLIKETIERIDQFKPVEVQTGPAFRNETLILDKHLRTLAAYPKLKYIYLKMTDSIINSVNA